jgi:hypothetical protein
MSAGGTGGVGGRREKTTALADECGSRCGARAATLTDEELEGGTGGTGSLSAHTGGPISSHSRASLCTRFAICLAPKSTPRRSRSRPAGGFWVRQLLAAHRESARWSISLHYRIASLQGWIAVDRNLPPSPIRPGRSIQTCRDAGWVAAGACVPTPGNLQRPVLRRSALMRINASFDAIVFPPRCDTASRTLTVVARHFHGPTAAIPRSSHGCFTDVAWSLRGHFMVG